jgi:hypothetical protein
MRLKGYVLSSLLLMVVLTGCGSDFEWFPGPSTALTIATTSPLPAGTLGTAYSQPFFASGGKAPYAWTLSSGTLPAGLTLSPFGILSGTPTATGSLKFSIKVTDSSSTPNTVTKEFTLQINGGPITITAATIPAAPTGIPYSQVIVTGGTPPYTFANLSTAAGRKLPHGLVLSTTDGILSGTPVAQTGTTSGSGTFAFTLSVSDSASPALSASQLLSILVPTTGRMYDPLNIVYAEGISTNVSGANTTVNITTVGNTDSVPRTVTVTVATYDGATGIQISPDLLMNAAVVPAATTISNYTTTYFNQTYTGNWYIKQVAMQ